MKQCVQSSEFFGARKQRRAAVLRKMAAMRAAKERKRLADPPPEREPKFQRYYPLELGLRDKRSGDVAWVDFKSVRDAARRLAIVRRYYLAGDMTDSRFQDSQTRD